MDRTASGVAAGQPVAGGTSGACMGRSLPVRILLTCAWHRRSADEVAERYDGDVWQPGETLPDGVEVAVFDDSETRWREAVFAFPNRGVVVFGDVVEGDGEGGLRMPPEWWPPHEERTGRIRNELRRVLDWPIDVVLVSHGELSWTIHGWRCNA
jgi:hypothetical protein